MSYKYRSFTKQTHRLIPSRYPPTNVFDWAESTEELEALAALEGLSNDRLSTQDACISLVAKEDWVRNPGASPLMAAFTHLGPSRFSDGVSFGVYYAADSIESAIAETKFHRERFLSASNEPPCIVQMRQYIATVKKELVDICTPQYTAYLNPNIDSYAMSQAFGRELNDAKEWGLIYPSVRCLGAECVGILRPPALSIPVQAGHFDYIWDGSHITEVRKAISCHF